MEKIVKVPVQKIVEKEVKVPVEKIVKVPVEKIVYKDRPVEIIKEIPQPKTNSNDKKLVEDVLYYYNLALTLQSLIKKQKDRVFVNQKVEIVDGTFEVWSFMREHYVNWLYKLFLSSVQHAKERKMYYNF